jgi:TatD DNase family protein
MYLVDSHCHLYMLDLTPDNGDLNQVIQRAQSEGVQHFLNVSVSLKNINTLIKMAEAYPFVTASVGLHPNEQDEAEANIETLVSLGSHPKVVAIGETGLDYFRSEGDLDWQRQRFRTHIAAAKQLNKPLIIHTRQAKDDTIRIMREEDAQSIGGVMHCFTEDWEMAEKALALGFYISFSGIVTFKNAADIQEVAKRMPLDRMLLETDCPYLAPNPFRGKPNEPSYMRQTAEFIANLRGISTEELAQQTTHNFFTLFKGAEKYHV